jgi:hypothetical protein
MVHYLRCTPIASMAHDIGISQCAFYRSFDPPHTSSIFRVPSTLTACVNASLPTSEMIDARWNTHVTPFVANRTESRCVTSATMNSTRDDAFYILLAMSVPPLDHVIDATVLYTPHGFSVSSSGTGSGRTISITRTILFGYRFNRCTTCVCVC